MPKGNAHTTCFPKALHKKKSIKPTLVVMPLSPNLIYDQLGMQRPNVLTSSSNGSYANQVEEIFCIPFWKMIINHEDNHGLKKTLDGMSLECFKV
jgi:hypothetical protein